MAFAILSLFKGTTYIFAISTRDQNDSSLFYMKDYKIISNKDGCYVLEDSEYNLGEIIHLNQHTYTIKGIIRINDFKYSFDSVFINVLDTTANENGGSNEQSYTVNLEEDQRSFRYLKIETYNAGGFTNCNTLAVNGLGSPII